MREAVLDGEMLAWDEAPLGWTAEKKKANDISRIFYKGPDHKDLSDG